MKLKCYNCLLATISIFFILVSPIYGDTEVIREHDESELVQKKTWCEAEVIKDVLISYLNLRERIPELKKDANFHSQQLSLLFLFDSMSSEKSLKILASLSPYYFGAFGGEIYHCLLIRKGFYIEKYLKTLLESDRNECFSRFGDKNRICLSHDQYKSEIRTVLKLISERENCILEY